MKWTWSRFALLLAIALTVWLWPSIFGGKVLLPLDIMSHNPPHEAGTAAPVHNPLIGDMLVENYAWHLFQRRALAAGELPLWNPDTFCGHPLYTTGQTSTFYPLNAIFLILPLPQAYVAFIWVHLLLGGLFTYLLCRRLGIGGFGAAIGGLTFAMSGFLAFRFVFPMLLASAIWLPLTLAWVHSLAGLSWPGLTGEAARSPSRWRRALLILGGPPLLAMPVLGGFYEIGFYSAAATGLFALLLIGRLAWRASAGAAARFTGRFVLAGVLGVLLAMPQLLPFFEVMNRNVRAGESSYEEVAAGGAEPYELLTLVMPDVLGNPARHQSLRLTERKWQPIRSGQGEPFHYFGPKNYVEVGFYFGLAPLAFALLAVAARGGERGYFVLLAGIAVALALGTPLYRLFFLVPGAEQVRTPFRWMYLAMAAGACLSALGAQHWYDRLTARPGGISRAAWLLVAALLAAGTLAVMAIFFRTGPAESLARTLLAENARARATFANPDELAGLLWLNGMRFALFALLAGLCVGLAYWFRCGPRVRGAASLLAFALVAIDLGQASYEFNTHADPAVLERTPPLLRHLQADSGPFRLGRYGPEKVFYSNLPMLYGLQDYGGYDSIILKDYATFLNAIEPQGLLRYNIVMNFERPSSLDSPLLPLLNIRYLLTPRQIEHKDWEHVPVEGNLNLYRIRPERELPRALLVGEVKPAASLSEAIARIRAGEIDVFKAAVVQADSVDGLAESGGGTAKAAITSYRFSSVQVAVDCDRRKLLVLCDVMYPGWKAYVDGKPAEVYTTNGIFRGVPVPAGQHLVEFRFEPASLRNGLALAGLAAVVTLALGLRGGTRSRREEGVYKEAAREPAAAPPPGIAQT